MIIEVCAGCLEDCILAQEKGAQRIELNSALSLGGLTPSFGTFLLARKNIEIPIICMVRPRAGGFCYSQSEQETMLQDAYLFLDNGAEGIAFGFLNEDGTIDCPATESMIELCHSMGKEAVFHRAIDCSQDIFESVNLLASLGCDRILTSGGRHKASQASEQLAGLIDFFGKEIEFCLGSGITPENIEELARNTSAQQFHGSFSDKHHDPTSRGNEVDFSNDSEGDIQRLNGEILIKAIATIHSLEKHS